MKTKTVALYDFDELPTEESKERARDWYRQHSEEDTYAAEYIKDDASNVGLVIESLDQHRANKGRFHAGPEETAHKIEKEHGPGCETYKTANAYLENRDRIINEHPRDTEGDFEYVGALDLSLDNLDAEFLHDILEDYRVMLEKEIEYQNADAQVDETIRANGYTFTADGRRED